MSRRAVPSLRAERSVREVRMTYGFLQWRWPTPARGRLRLGAKPVASLEHLVIPHMASIAEEFSRELLLDGTRALVPSAPAVLEVLWERAERDAEATWEKQTTAWKSWHGIDVRAANEYKVLEGVIQARNAIVHGLGELTRRQLGNDGGTAMKTRLASVGIPVVGRRLLIDAAAAARCSDIVVAYILWIDAAAAQRGVLAPI
jgi:hypothetical protein